LNQIQIWGLGFELKRRKKKRKKREEKGLGGLRFSWCC